jgi:conjugative relaxase-like TrwC/TraI family protein
MQTTHKIPGDSAVRYAKYLTSTATRGDYYTTDGADDQPVPSRWHGSPDLLASLGLDPESPVERSDLRAVMQGFSPLSGQPLRPAGSDGTRVAGVELTFSPPKSVSALWAVSGPDRRAQIEAAHHRAVASTLARIEREVALVRRRSGGEVRFECARSLFGAEFVHTSSRLAQDQEAGGIPDPQVHSHLVLFAAERFDGRLAAIESRRLYRSAREHGAWFRAVFAAELSQMGLPIERRTGRAGRYFEIKGVPEQLGSHWSSRSEDVDRAARIFRQRYGREPRAEELGSLTIATRGDKSAADPIDVNKAWRAVGEEYGLNAERAGALFDERTISGGKAVNLRRELLEEVTRERATIEDRELRAKAYEIAAGACRPEQADRLIAELARSGELVRLEGGRWTTQRLREMEQATLQIADRSLDRDPAPVAERFLKQARREIIKEIHGPLSVEQREALDLITGPGRVSVLLGRAGTGKGVVLSAAARAWQLEGHQVIGTAIAGATAQRLREDAGLDRSFTTDALINGVEDDRIHLSSRSVVIMDEAGMADTERLSRLMEATDRAGATLVLAGDSAQLGPIGAGGMFEQLRERVPCAELTDVHRANHEWERKAWEQVREGQPAPALAAYRAHDRLHIHDTRAEAAEAMVEEWNRCRHEGTGGAVMITDASNAERDQINAMAQERRAQAGELGARSVPLSGKPYGLRAGDEVIFSAQLPLPGRRVENGTRGTVIDTARHADRVTIETHEREPREVSVATHEFPDVGLAYAQHLYKAQGSTVERSQVMLGGWQTDREGAYVALSRARERTDIHVSREDLGEQGLDVGAIERLGERMRETRAQEASIAREREDREAERRAEIERELRHSRDHEQGMGIE